MLLIIILIIMILLGLIFSCLEVRDRIDFDGFGIFLTGIGSVLLVISIVIIILAHAFADNDIQKNKIQYEGLCKRYEIIKSDYEDVSKSDVINDITEWNTEVYNTKYWAENPWTNWFNSKKVADNLEYISLDE